MMFSSRRSRNRHSANPNPKLHSPHLRRKISPHDGRTSQPHPLLTLPGINLTPPSGTSSSPAAAAAAAAAAASQMTQFPGGMPLMAGIHGIHGVGGQGSHPHSGSSLSSGGGCDPGVEIQGRNYYASSDGSDPSDDEDDLVEDLDDRLSQSSVEEDCESVIPPPHTNHLSNASPSKGVRKRKSQNPTRLQLQPDSAADSSSDHDAADAASSGGHSKRTKGDEDQPHPHSHPHSHPHRVEEESKNGLPSAETSAPPQQHLAARFQPGAESNPPEAPDRSRPASPSSALHHHPHTLALAHSHPHFNNSAVNGASVIHPYPLDTEDEDEEEDASDADAEGDHSDSQSTSSALAASILAGYDVPIDKDNPRRCSACGKIFQNHFGVKTHYQNVSCLFIYLLMSFQLMIVFHCYDLKFNQTRCKFHLIHIEKFELFFNQIINCNHY